MSRLVAPSGPDGGLLAGARWALVAFRDAGGRERAGVLDAAGQVRRLVAHDDASLPELLARWDEGGVAASLRALDPAALPVVADATLAPPVRPAKVVLAGANYRSHVAEMGGTVPDGVRPFFFLKPPSTTVVAHGSDVPIDPGPGVAMDWEGELAAVIGRRTRKISPDEAMASVAGYVVLNDLTDRARLQRPDPVLAPPFAYDWLASKCMDASCPVGATFVPAALVDDPMDLRIRVWVNDALKQDGTTADMVSDIPTLIAEASSVMTLEPGDVLATGTPAGVGAGRGERLAPGDVVVVQIDGVGRLENRLVAGATTGAGPDDSVRGTVGT